MYLYMEAAKGLGLKYLIIYVFVCMQAFSGQQRGLD